MNEEATTNDGTATSRRWLTAAIVAMALAPVVWFLAVTTPWDPRCGAYGLRVSTVLKMAHTQALVSLERDGELPQTFWDFVFDSSTEGVFEALRAAAVAECRDRSVHA